MSTQVKPKNKGNKGLRTGSIFKRVERNERGRVTRMFYEVRRRFTDANGISREKKRRVSSYNDALDADREIKDEIARELAAPKQREAERTFGDLAAFYKKEYMVPPRYVGGVKVAGLHSHHKLLTPFNVLVAQFGDRPLRSITHDDLRRFKKLRLDTPTRPTKKEPHGHQRSLSPVNRELALMRRMLNVARHKRWLASNPFGEGDSLINVEDEVKRMRILTHDEERRLLAACGPRTLTYKRNGREITVQDDGSRRSHLRAAVVLSIDTAARHGEEFELTWRDVDLENGVITINGMISKTGRERIVPITDRLRTELVKLWEASDKNPDARVIPYSGVKTSFRNALAYAGIKGYRWHDNRHVGTVHMIEAGIPEAKVMKITGHTQIKTFLRYLNMNVETAQSAAVLLNARRATLDEMPREEAERAH